MAVGFSNTNKPLNPRGQDASPKAFNRAKLFSGKALDFDGVNDYVDIGQNLGFINTGDFTYLANAKFDVLSGDECIMGQGSAGAGAAILALVNGNGFFRFAFYGDDLDWDEPVETGKWYSLAFTYNRTTKARAIYVNGQLAVSDVSTLTPNATSNNFVIGKVPYSATYADAQITGVKAFSTALTAAQVADLYNNPEKVVPTGVANTALKLFLPMQEGAGTYCINGADPLGDDKYNGAGSFDSATGWTLNTGTSITGGQLVIDGTQTASTSAYYNISSVASSLAMVQFTLSNVTAGQIQLAFFGASGTTTKWYTSSGTYTEYVEVQAGHNGNTGFIANADFVGNIDNLTLKVVNTGAISGATWTHGIGAPVAQTAVIDWNKETTGAGTTMLLPQGLTTGRDITGVNLFENVRKQGALNLDGNSWAEVHDNESLDFSSGMSLEAWVQIDDTDGNQHILGKWDYANSGREYLLYYNSASNYFAAMFGHGTSRQFASFPITATGQWFHFVGTTDGSTITPYVNGVAGTTAAQTTSLAASDIPVTIGMENTHAVSNSSTKGPIAQPRIYNRALTAAEVLQNYNSGKNTYK